MKVTKQNKPSYECMSIAETACILADDASMAAQKDWVQYHCNTGFIFLAFAIEAMFIFYRRQVEPGYDKNNDRMSRKDFHKKTLSMCGFDKFLGSADYQTCAKCLKIRDGIAHGDTYESSFEHPSKHPSGTTLQTIEILAVQSEQFRDISPQILRKGIEAAKRIDEFICDNARHPGIEEADREYAPIFLQAFGVTGTSMWE
ncbi:hypothetical protein [Brenneria tiliae]|uniref:hypothetical protein n=1 Tax=Brenneria tiliae TaxID=2914984 RepID=UPI002014CA1D|nr:hypothetical protein [Brenneria tiliae]MCL2897165.1 hypothetical protein [Brenneria tiliae]MCL2904818.1 hypothetical protein [Brenneria tiliae]